MTNSIEDVESKRAQLHEALETIRFQSGLLTQVCGFLIAADAALISYGLTTSRAGLLLLSAAFPVLMWIAFRFVLFNLIPFFYVGIILERQLLAAGPRVIDTYVHIMVPKLHGVLSSTTSPQAGELHKRTRFFGGFRSSTMAQVLLIGTIAQLALFVSCLWALHMSFA